MRVWGLKFRVYFVRGGRWGHGHLPASTRDAIHSLGVRGRRRWVDDGEEKAGGEDASVGVRAWKKWAEGSGEEEERLEREGCSLRG